MKTNKATKTEMQALGQLARFRSREMHTKKKPIAFMSFEEWIADQIKALAPHAKTIRPIGVYFATAGDDDVNVDFNRKVSGYGNWHFTTKSLADFYGAFYCSFNSEYGVTLVFDSYDKVVAEGGFWKPKRKGW